MVDLVYILGKGSPWQNNEILYSLRSVELYLKNFRNVFIIGDKPKFFNDNVTEVPYKDIYANKNRNIMCKILRACNDERISHDFILFNDDYFLIEEIDAENYPYYYSTDLITASNYYINSYQKCIQSTLKMLTEKRMQNLYFDVHRPIIYNRYRFRKMVKAFDWEIPYGPVVKSLYCNYNNIPGVKIKDNKINYPYRADAILKAINGEHMFSIGDKSLNNHMKAYLMNKFPKKSKFEL